MIPFRRQLGVLGMLLVRIGQYFQREYAGWNSEFRLKWEPTTYPNIRKQTVHVTTRLTQDGVQTYIGPKSQTKIMPECVVELFKLNGVEHVLISGYEMEIQIGGAFFWEELRPQIERILIEKLAMHKQVLQAA